MKNFIGPIIALCLILLVSGSSFEEKNSDTPVQLNISNDYTAGKKISQIISEKRETNDFSKERIFNFDKWQRKVITHLRLSLKHQCLISERKLCKIISLKRIRIFYSVSPCQIMAPLN